MKQFQKAKIRSQLIDQTKIFQSHHPPKILPTLSLNEAKDGTKILGTEKTRAAGEGNLTQTENLESTGSEIGIHLTQTKHPQKTASLQIVSENLNLDKNLIGEIKSLRHELKIEIETGIAHPKVQVQEVEAMVMIGLIPQIQLLTIEEGIADKKTRTSVEARVEVLETKKFMKVVGIRARGETEIPQKTEKGAQSVMILEKSMTKIGKIMWPLAFLQNRSPPCKPPQILLK